MSEKAGGFFERIQGKIHPVVVEYYYGPRVMKSGTSFPYLVRVMQAHVVMLAECHIIPKTAAGQLLSVLSRLAEQPPRQAALDPKLEDLYINLESILNQELGPDIAGYMPVARSRNDVEAAMWRMELREKLVELANSALSMSATLIDRAAENAEALMPGYTYGQQAQPITMGYYLAGLSAALLRDVDRVLDCTRRLNYCPLGAAALAGTGYPIDRSLTARLLGFAGVMEHAQDAIATADYMLEAVSAGVICLNTLARLADDIIKWCSNEVGFATLPDDLIDSSSIMPQKRNPVIVATVRSHARLLAGRFAGICAACSVGFEASRDVTVAWEEVLECVNIVNGMCKISEAYTAGLQFNTAAMEQALGLGFINATEITDTLVREGGMSFRAAHQVVGGVVADLHSRGEGPQGFTYGLLNEWCQRVTGASLQVDKTRIEIAMDNRVGVERRKSVGGPAPAEVRRMLDVQKRQILNFQETISKLQGEWEAAKEELRKRSVQLMT